MREEDPLFFYRIIDVINWFMSSNTVDEQMIGLWILNKSVQTTLNEEIKKSIFDSDTYWLLETLMGSPNENV